LTASGWCVVPGTGSIAILGADRHGALAEEYVTIEPAKGDLRRAIVGTESAIGTFASTTRLALNDGRSVSAEEVIADTDETEFWFENVTAHLSDITVSRVLRSFQSSILACSSRQTARRYLRAKATTTKTVAREEPGGYCVHHKPTKIVVLSDGVSTKARSWKSHVLESVKSIWLDDDKFLSFEIDGPEVGACLWYLSAARASRELTELRFESMQYSTFVTAVEIETPVSPISRCRTAFYSIKPSDFFVLNWQTKSWRPVISGFLGSGK
jgi:hypothetical protein